MKKILLLLGVVLIAFLGLFLIKPTSPTNSSNSSGAILSINIEKPNFVATGKNLTKVEIATRSSGDDTDILETDLQVLGDAELISTAKDGTQLWQFPIPQMPLMVVGIYARGYDKDNRVTGVQLSVRGLNEIYNALWALPEDEAGVRWLDSGRVFVFGLNERFSLVLDNNRYPENKLGCKPAGIVNKTSDVLTTTASGSYSVNYETAKAGSCTLSSNDFSTIINVLDDLAEPRIITDKNNGFSLTYSGRAYRSNISTALPLNANAAARIELARNGFENTNLSEAFVAIGVNKDPKVVTDCTKIAEGEAAVAPRTLGGIEFQAFKSQGVAAGTFSDSISYRTVRNNACYVINREIRSGNLGNYTPGEIRAFTQKQAEEGLEALLVGFKFI